MENRFELPDGFKVSNDLVSPSMDFLESIHKSAFIAKHADGTTIVPYEKIISVEGRKFSRNAREGYEIVINYDSFGMPEAIVAVGLVGDGAEICGLNLMGDLEVAISEFHGGEFDNRISPCEFYDDETEKMVPFKSFEGSTPRRLHINYNDGVFMLKWSDIKSVEVNNNVDSGFGLYINREFCLQDEDKNLLLSAQDWVIKNATRWSK